MEIKSIRGLSKENDWKYSEIGKQEIDQVMVEAELVLCGLSENIIDKFKKWYPSNMDIVHAFVDLADLLRIDGKREYYSARAIFEHLRWNTLFEDTDTQFKITDNVCAPLVRMVMHLRPRFSGMFRLRGITPKETIPF